MESMNQILGKEKDVNNCIYLYRMDGYWIAYERSAFYLYSICHIDYVFRCAVNKNTLLIAVIKDDSTICKPQLTVVESSREQMILNCSITCKGFEYWKNGFIPLFSKELYINVIPKIKQMISHDYKYSACY